MSSNNIYSKIQPRRNLSSTEFVSSANKIHHNKYDYTNTNFTKLTDKISISCPMHGEFIKLAYLHLNGSGCKKCTAETLSKKYMHTREQFIDKVSKIHDNKYDYSLVKYNGDKNPVIIICKTHGKFTQIAGYHSAGNGCPTCGYIKNGDNCRMSIDDFINKSNNVHNSYYDYSASSYVNNQTKLEIICKNHGSFFQTPSSHLAGNGCSKCAAEYTSKRISLTTEQFIDKVSKIHDNKYDYSLVKYNGDKNPVIIICKTHGKFTQIAGYHSAGNGCPTCRESKGEQAIRKVLKELSVEFIPQKRFDNCIYKNKLAFDFYLPTYNICIEYDGEGHYMPIYYTTDTKKHEEYHNLTLLRDNIKNNFCLNNGILLLRIPYFNYSMISDIIKTQLGFV